MLYIDYGNEEEMAVSDLRQIIPKYTHLPAHAMPCALAHVSKISVGWQKSLMAEWLEQVSQ